MRETSWFLPAEGKGEKPTVKRKKELSFLGGEKKKKMLAGRKERVSQFMIKKIPFRIPLVIKREKKNQKRERCFPGKKKKEGGLCFPGAGEEKALSFPSGEWGKKDWKTRSSRD